VPETINWNASELSAVAGMKAWLYGLTTGVLLNTGGDTLTEIDTLTAPASGAYTFSLAESRVGLGTLRAVMKSSGGAPYRDGILREASTIVEDVNMTEVLEVAVSAGAGAGTAAEWTAGSITGFPTTLVIGDSYIDDVDRHIKIYYRDSEDTPITAIGDRTFIDEDFEAVLTVGQDNLSSIVRATCVWVPAVGLVEGYVKVQLPKDQTRRAGEGDARMQLVFRWGDTVEVLIASQAVSWTSKNVGD
jgi:hypothetical protein